jgi:hypothetical protein
VLSVRRGSSDAEPLPSKRRSEIEQGQIERGAMCGIRKDQHKMSSGKQYSSTALGLEETHRASRYLLGMVVRLRFDEEGYEVGGRC